MNTEKERKVLVEKMHQEINDWDAKMAKAEEGEEKPAILLITEERSLGAGSKIDKATFASVIFTDLPKDLQMTVIMGLMTGFTKD